MPDPDGLPVVLGWGNPEHDSNTRLYALDRGESPRWAPGGGRTVEQALAELGAREGDRFMLVKVSDRG